MEKETKLKELTPQQELFLIAYTRDGDTFGNASLSYAEAYNYDLENASKENQKDKNGKEILYTSEYDRLIGICASSASRLLRNENIIAHKRRMLMRLYDDDTFSDTRLLEIIKQGKDADTINAIKVRNDLKQRIVKKLDVNVINRPFADLSDDELAKLAL